MVQVHESLSSTHSYPKQALWVYSIPSNLFLLLPPMSIKVDLFLFLYFQDDLKYHCVLMLQEACLDTSMQLYLALITPQFNMYSSDSNKLRLAYTLLHLASSIVNSATKHWANLERQITK
jgi:hypothetical protein